MKEKIILFGTGFDATQFYIKYKSKVKILYCFDNAATCNQKWGEEIEVVKPDVDKIIRREALIVIATNKYYHEIKKYLIELGLKEYKDFVNHEGYDKKLVIIHGNCHMEILKIYLQSSKEFSEKYYIHRMPLIYAKDMHVIEDYVLKTCEIFIHQHISSANAYGYKFSDEYILPRLSKKCQVILFPNFTNLAKGFFPQDNKDNKRGMPEKFFIGDITIDSEVEKGNLCPDNILNKMLTGEYLNKTEVIKNFDICIETMKEKEKEWDIKILDYIILNYKEKQLFYSSNHPTNLIMEELAKRLLNRIGVFDTDIFSHKECDLLEIPMYPCVSDWLGLHWKQKIIRKTGIKSCKGDMNFKEYIKEYLMDVYNVQFDYD